MAPRGPWLDHRFFLAKAERYGPIFKISLLHRPIVCIVGARLGHELLQDHRARLRPAPVRYDRFIPGGFLRYMEGEDHARYRKLFQLGFARSVLERYSASIEDDVRNALGVLAESCGNPSSHGPAPRAAFRDMLFVILVRLFFGISQEADAFPRMRDLYEKIDVRKTACGSTDKEIEAAREVAEIIERQADHIKAQAHSATAFPTSFLAEILRHDPDAASDETVLLNLVYIAEIARVDLTGLLMWIVKKLSDNPQCIQNIRETGSEKKSPRHATLEQLASAVVKETLRLDQSEFIYRTAGADIPFKGYTLPSGWLIRICIREGHRDPDIFPEPERFDPYRFIEHTYSARDYSPLGLLDHSCLGAQVVDLVGRTFVIVLAREFDWSVASDGPREFGAAHWTPNSDFRIKLTRRR